MSAFVAVPVSAIGGRRVAAAAVGPSASHGAGATQAHAFASGLGHHALLVDRSRIYDVDAAFGEALQAAAAQGPEAERRLLAALGLERPPAIDPAITEPPPVSAIALAVSQHCNLGCGYCYADGGSFASEPRHMPWDVARAAIDRVVASAPAGASVKIAFMGGEPLLAREVLRRAALYAGERTAARGQRLLLALTTNATVLREDDAEFLAEQGFAVTVSLDGEAALHDRLRPRKGGGGSHAAILARLPALLRRQGQPARAGRAPLQVTARLTATPQHRALRQSVESLMALGFHSVGVSPSLSARDPALQLDAADLDALLAQMIELADAFEAATLAGRHYPLSNMLALLRELHRGTHRPWPCGAGAGYLGVDADGALSACHRFVDDPRAAMGHVDAGIDDAARQRWLAARRVERQEPCASCWARYLCGGGCHHEVLARGRVACDFIRGWLHHGLQVYVRLAARRPELFD
jgi:uncharacterized protein